MRGFGPLIRAAKGENVPVNELKFALLENPVGTRIYEIERFFREERYLYLLR
ncbi:MAG: hypothetical protein WA667_18980 [Candidatus Nitrosopolaris sp.]